MQIDKKSKSLMIGLLGVFVLFAVLVPVYFAVSNGLPDGLDKQLEENNVQEKEPVYNPPFSQLIDYGSDVSSYIVNGLIGGIVVLVIGLVLARILSVRGSREKSQSTKKKLNIEEKFKGE